jgi:hypothetical protein
MFEQLPETIQRKVIEYLNSNNFVAAKQLHDAWINQHTVMSNATRTNTTAVNANQRVSAETH